MSALDDLIKEIPDAGLRDRINAEFSKLKATKKFGLVFEDQKPEITPLYDMPIKINSPVAEKIGKMNQIYRVQKIEGEDVTCTKYIPTEETFNFKLNELVRVALFGEPIYPYLQKLDSICNAPDSDLWHTLIEADNYHALQLLQYACKDRKVDCIYIDPPYNTGAKDWKYNDDYVDASDLFRHSKWLSMMQKRLLLAKDILSDSGAIFISIDDNEQANLKLLCDKIFGRNNFVAQFSWRKRTAKSDVPFGISQDCEWILCYSNAKFVGGLKGKERKYYLTEDFPNRAWRFHDLTTQKVASARPNSDFTIVNPKNGKEYPNNPMRCWAITKETFQEYYDANKIIFPGDYDFLKISKPVMRYWKDEDMKKAGADFGIVAASTNLPAEVGMTQDGTKEITNIFGDKRFPFPNPIQLIKHLLNIATIRKPNALIVDFFAGSGTTLHAVNLLNAEDGGKRRCILITNNEVAEAEERNLRNQGYQPTDEEWQKLGIARYVTWQRTVCSIKGENIKGEPLAGNYLGSEIPMANGFKANAIFFKLGFLNKNAVALGRQFREILSLIWLKAGSYGICPNLDSEEELPPMLILPENKFAVLLEEEFFMEFEEKILELSEIETIFIVTDSLEAYRQMIQNLRDRKTYQLYRDYLENFKINIAP